ncbi:MAG: RdgB/HAM1 family non-canonical purine NTP pyrophosphatase [Candidatus Velthaea sp.]
MSAQRASRPVRVYVATTNPGKLKELEALFAASPFQLETFAGYDDPLEGSTSYAENAALKARALHAQLQRAGRPGAVLADDSGLEVYALDRRPGVLTAFYGGAGASWAVRRAKLLEELEHSGSRDRRARFVCALHFIDEAGREYAALGTVDGAIAREERGSEGFSFDPIFWFAPAERTFAELTAHEKNRVSHRAVAVTGLLAALEAGSA